MGGSTLHQSSLCFWVAKFQTVMPLHMIMAHPRSRFHVYGIGVVASISVLWYKTHGLDDHCTTGITGILSQEYFAQ